MQRTDFLAPSEENQSREFTGAKSLEEAIEVKTPGLTGNIEGCRTPRERLKAPAVEVKVTDQPRAPTVAIREWMNLD
jgi:hypothetical protein